MSARVQLVFGAAAAVLAAIWVGFGLSVPLFTVAVALALTWLIAYPKTALALMLATLSCDQVLTFRASDSVNLRVAHLCALALFIRMLFEKLHRRERWGTPRGALQPLVVYLALACVGAFASANLAKSVGYLAWAAADVFVLFAVVLELSRTPEGFRTVRRAWMAGALIAGVFGLVQLGLGFVHLPVPFAAQRVGEFPRIDGFSYEPAYYVLYLEAVAAVYLGRFARGGPGAARAGLLGAVLLVPAGLSMSRSGWLGMALLAAYVTWRAVHRVRARALTAAVAVAGCASCALLLALPPHFVEQAPRMAAMAFDVHEQSSTAPRLDKINQALELFRRHPLLGVGLGGYGGYVEQHPELLLYLDRLDASKIGPSTLWLEIAAELGLFGVLLLLWFVARLVRALWRTMSLASLDDAGWAEGFLVSVVLVFAVLFQFNQTLWRLDIWVLIALAWSTVVRARARAEAA